MIASGEAIVPQRIHELLQEVIDRLTWRERKKYENEIALIWEARLMVDRLVMREEI